MSCNPVCYDLSPTGYPAGVYSLQYIDNVPMWFHPADAGGVVRVVSTPALLTELNAGIDPSKIVMCSASTTGPTDAIPGAADIPNSTSWTFPTNKVRGFTVSREGAGQVVVDTPAGTQVTLHRNGTRTWSLQDGSYLDVSNVTITTGANSRADVVWEQ